MELNIKGESNKQPYTAQPQKAIRITLIQTSLLKGQCLFPLNLNKTQVTKQSTEFMYAKLQLCYYLPLLYFISSECQTNVGSVALTKECIYFLFLVPNLKTVTGLQLRAKPFHKGQSSPLHQMEDNLLTIHIK